MRLSSYSKDQLIACGKGELFGPGNAQLPVDNMLMIDRIIEINDSGGEYEKGFIRAEVTKYEDYTTLGGEQKVKEAGKNAVDKAKDLVDGDDDKEDTDNPETKPV